MRVRTHTWVKEDFGKALMVARQRFPKPAKKSQLARFLAQRRVRR